MIVYLAGLDPSNLRNADNGYKLGSLHHGIILVSFFFYVAGRHKSAPSNSIMVEAIHESLRSHRNAAPGD